MNTEPPTDSLKKKINHRWTQMNTDRRKGTHPIAGEARNPKGNSLAAIVAARDDFAD
jgi:hypothetical protein